MTDSNCVQWRYSAEILLQGKGAFTTCIGCIRGYEYVEQVAIFLGCYSTPSLQQLPVAWPRMYASRCDGAWRLPVSLRGYASYTEELFVCTGSIEVDQCIGVGLQWIDWPDWARPRMLEERTNGRSSSRHTAHTPYTCLIETRAFLPREVSLAHSHW